MVFPGFTFGWLSLISHRSFMPKLLLAEGAKGWPLFQKLLVSLFRFLVPFLSGGELRDTTRTLYKGTLRVMLVLLHDFPEFLCDYHFSFCDVIPNSCIQLRNLILSAFPRNMRLPDPFTPNLKVDMLQDIHQPPRVLSDYTSGIPLPFRRDLDLYLRIREEEEEQQRQQELLEKGEEEEQAEGQDKSSGDTTKSSTTSKKLTTAASTKFLENIQETLAVAVSTDTNRSSVALSSSDKALISGGTKYNIPMMNALVLYVGVQGIAQLHSKTDSQSSSPIAHTASMDVYQQLLMALDREGRYLFLSAIANQLRYPNSHTHYFSRVLLYLFFESEQESIKEQITR